MRCRFCSKSIPLLRRLSDAQFCSDAHRDAYNDEQKLAFERLMTTQAIGKTQRMPAYHQAAEIPQGRPPTQTMVAAGGFQAYFLDTPLPFSKHNAASDPMASGLTVFFCEHTVAFPARFRQSGRLARVPVKAGRGNLKPWAESLFISEWRASLPPAATRPLRWQYSAPVVDTDPAPITRLWPVGLSVQNIAAAESPAGLLWLTGTDYRVPLLAIGAARAQLRAVRSLCTIAAPGALSAEARAWPVELLHAFASLTSYPSGRQLRALAEAIPAAPVEDEELSSLFEAFSAQPLASCRHLPSLASAVLRFGAPASPAMLPLPPVQSPLPAHETEPAGISALPWVKRTFAPRAVEPAAPARAAMARVAPLANGGIRLENPRRKAPLGVSGLTRFAQAQPLRSMAGATISSRPAVAAAIESSLTPSIPAAAMRGGLRLPSAGITAYAAKIDPARSASRGWIPEPAPVVAGAAIPGLPAKHRMAVQAKGSVLAVTAPAARPASGERITGAAIVPSYRPATPPLRLSPLRSGHTDGRTRCFAVPPPLPDRARREGASVEWIAEPEMALLPGSLRAIESCLLQRPSNALFRVPNAQPLPKAGHAAPLALPMSDWGSKPLMRPANLRASDGSDFEENTSGGWRSALRERFAGFGSLPSFGRLRRLPPDIKWIAMAVPLIIGIWVVARPEGKASNAPVQISGGVPQAEVEAIPAPAAEEAQAVAAVEPDPPGLKKQKEIGPAPAQAAEPSRWDILQAKIVDRAAVDIVEDFRSGLSRWDGKGNWARTWSYDRSGTVRPGNLAIFEPTTGLRNYNFEMKAAVDKRVIQWLVRATDLSNYHINRLIITPDAAQTKMELQRWTVYKGRAGRVKLVPLPHGPANQTLFAIRVDVQGDSVTTYLGDQVIDTFSDPRFVAGGIGLAGAPGDQARVYAVRVSHQTDFLGKLCSFLAPQPMNMQGTD